MRCGFIWNGCEIFYGSFESSSCFRTYAIKKISSSNIYELDDTVAYQVYGGIEKQTKEGILASFSILGEIVSYNDKVADIFCHCTCGGHTDSLKAVWGKFLEYILGVRCNYCKETPHYIWK